MRHNSLNNIAQCFSVAVEALAEVMLLPADGLTIHEAMNVGKATQRHLESIAKTREWLHAIQSGVTIEQ